MKICLIGCGDIANAAHGPSIMRYKKENPDITLAACCDANEDKAREYSQTFGFKSYYIDYIKMLETENPDAVLLLTPLELSPRFAIEILSRDIALLMEKPPGRDKKEIEDIVNSAKGINMVAFNRRHMPLLKALKEQLSGKRIQAIHYELYRSGRRDADFSTTAIHGIDAMAYLAGANHESADFVYQKLEPDSAATNVFMRCRFTNGVYGTLHTAPLSGAVIERATVHWEGGVSFLNLPVWGGIDYINGLDAPGSLTTVLDGKTACSISGEDMPGGIDGFVANGFYDQLAYFLECVREGKMPEHIVQTGINAVCVMNAMKERKAQYSKEE